MYIPEKTEAGWEGGDRGWDSWIASLTHGHEFEQASGNREGQGSLACCSPRGHRVGYDFVTEQQLIYMLGLMVTSIIYIMAALLSGDEILLIKIFLKNTFCMT